MIPIIGAVVAILLIVGVVFSAYRKPQPNEALIVTGFGLSETKAVRGRGVFVIPGLQTARSLDLRMSTLPFKVTNVNTSTQVPLDVQGNVTLGIGADESMIRIASQRLLGKSDEERELDLIEPIKGQIRGLLGSMAPEDVTNNRDEFQSQVMSKIQDVLASFGIEATSIQITQVSDQNGFIQNLYAEDIANREAQAKEAQSKAEARARKVVAEQTQLANLAEQESKRKIAEQNKETAVLEAQFKIEQDTKRGKADQAYKLAEAEASKAVIETEGQANTVRAEQEAYVAEKAVQTAKNKFEAEVVAKTDADAQATRLNAEANADAVKLEAEADAVKIKQIGQAQADATLAQGSAEAEAKAKMAQALAEQAGALLAQQVIEKLPEIVKAQAEAIANIDNMTVFNGAEGVNGMVNNGMAQAFDIIKNTTGVDMADVINKRADGRLTVDGDASVKVKSK